MWVVSAAMGDESKRVTRCRVGEAELAVVSVPLGAPPSLTNELTASELDVCQRMLAGQTNREIARCRGTAQRTVANQVQGIFRKLAVSSRNELAALVAAHRRREES